MASFIQAQQIPECRSVNRWVEEIALERVVREEQETQINRIINRVVRDPYSRMIIKLHALDGWPLEYIADCAGVPKETISQTIRKLRPQVLSAIRETIVS
jgi:DNA-directed RNA polymerase specialized sigma24 family protein